MKLIVLGLLCDFMVIGNFTRRLEYYSKLFFVRLYGKFALCVSYNVRKMANFL